MLIFLFNILLPFLVGLLVPYLQDKFTSPHCDPHWMKSLMAAGCSVVGVTVFHVVEDNSLPLHYGVLLAAGVAIIGSFCYKSLSAWRDKRPADKPLKGKTRNRTRGLNKIPSFESARRDHSPIAQKRGPIT